MKVDMDVERRARHRDKTDVFAEESEALDQIAKQVTHLTQYCASDGDPIMGDMTQSVLLKYYYRWPNFSQVVWPKLSRGGPGFWIVAPVCYLAEVVVTSHSITRSSHDMMVAPSRPVSRSQQPGGAVMMWRHPLMSHATITPSHHHHISMNEVLRKMYFSFVKFLSVSWTWASSRAISRFIFSQLTWRMDRWPLECMDATTSMGLALGVSMTRFASFIVSVRVRANS